MLTVTEELWITEVSTRPTSVAISGFFSDPRRFTTACTSFMLAMVLSPRNSTPKPMMMSANFLIFSLLTNIAVSAPTRRITGAYADRLNETSWEVIVVPMLAPKITPAA